MRPASDASGAEARLGGGGIFRRVGATPGLVLATGAVCSVVAALLVHHEAEARRDQEFLRRSDQVVLSVENRLDAYVALLRGAAGLYAGSREVTGAEFSAYVSRVSLIDRYPGVQGIGFSAAVTPGRVQDTVRRLPAGSRLWPRPDRAESAILFLEPSDRRNRVALGFDMYGEPVRREAMARARDQGAVAVSGPVTLVQEIDEQKQPGFLIYLPIYDTAQAPATVEARRARLLGWIYSPFRAHDFFNQTFQRSTALDLIEVTIQDGDTVLFRSGAEARGGRTVVRAVQVPGRTWAVRVDARPGFARDALLFPLLVLVTGLAITAALTLVAMTQRQRLKQSEAQTLSAEASARRAELLLAEVNHRVANSLQLVASMVSMQGDQAPPAARQALADARTRILAVARVHQRLYTSGSVEVVDLKAYLHNLVEELAQSFDGDGRRLELQAVEATVPTDKAVSVGVALAELVTNAAKYAYPDERPGAIRVSLARPAADRLELAVEDDGVGFAPAEGQPRGTGLGMKVVRAMASNLKADMSVAPRTPGTRVSLSFLDT